MIKDPSPYQTTLPLSSFYSSHLERGKAPVKG